MEPTSALSLGRSAVRHAQALQRSERRRVRAARYGAALLAVAAAYPGMAGPDTWRFPAGVAAGAALVAALANNRRTRGDATAERLRAALAARRAVEAAEAEATPKGRRRRPKDAAPVPAPTPLPGAAPNMPLTPADEARARLAAEARKVRVRAEAAASVGAAFEPAPQPDAVDTPAHGLAFPASAPASSPAPVCAPAPDPAPAEPAAAPAEPPADPPAAGAPDPVEGGRRRRADQPAKLVPRSRDGRRKAPVPGARRTEEALRTLAREGWVIRPDLAAAFSGIAHVAVGPPGVFLLDSSHWDGDLVFGADGVPHTRRLGGAGDLGSPDRIPRQMRLAAAEHHEAVAGMLGRQPWVHAVAVVWAPWEPEAGEAAPLEHDGVAYVRGADLTGWLRNRRPVYTSEEVTAVVDALTRLPVNVGHEHVG